MAKTYKASSVRVTFQAAARTDFENIITYIKSVVSAGEEPKPAIPANLKSYKAFLDGVTKTTYTLNGTIDKPNGGMRYTDVTAFDFVGVSDVLKEIAKVHKVGKKDACYLACSYVDDAADYGVDEVLIYSGGTVADTLVGTCKSIISSLSTEQHQEILNMLLRIRNEVM